jgi:hypothetical protein
MPLSEHGTLFVKTGKIMHKLAPTCLYNVHNGKGNLVAKNFVLPEIAEKEADRLMTETGDTHYVEQTINWGGTIPK